MTLFVAQNSTLQQDYKLVANIRGLIALSHTIIVEIKNVPLVYGWQTVYTKTERDNYTNPGTTFITGVPTTVYVPTKEPYLQIERSSTVISAITLERPWSRMWQEHGPALGICFTYMADMSNSTTVAGVCLLIPYYLPRLIICYAQRILYCTVLCQFGSLLIVSSFQYQSIEPVFVVCDCWVPYL